MPVQFIYEPWLAPIEVQEAAGCIIGERYPDRIVIHEEVSSRNAIEMNQIMTDILAKDLEKYCNPSDKLHSQQGKKHKRDHKRVPIIKYSRSV